MHCLQVQHILVKATSFAADSNNEGDCVIVLLLRSQTFIRKKDANEKWPML